MKIASIAATLMAGGPHHHGPYRIARANAVCDIHGDLETKLSDWGNF